MNLANKLLVLVSLCLAFGSILGVEGILYVPINKEGGKIDLVIDFPSTGSISGDDFVKVVNAALEKRGFSFAGEIIMGGKAIAGPGLWTWHELHYDSQYIKFAPGYAINLGKALANFSESLRILATPA